MYVHFKPLNSVEFVQIFQMTIADAFVVIAGEGLS